MIAHAEGPIPGGQTLTGTLTDTSDIDYYVFYVNGPQTVTVQAFDTTNDPGVICAAGGVFDGDGNPINATTFSTPAGVNRYFVQIAGRSQASCKLPTNYTLRVDPGNAVTTGPALDRATTQTDEPNDSAALSSGPLAAGVAYVGAHDRSDDQDWLTFTTPVGQQQLALTVTAPGPNRNFDGCAATAAVYSSTDPRDLIGTAVGDWTRFGRLALTLNGGTRYYVKMGVENSGCLGQRWQVRFDLTPVTAPPPPPPPPGSTAATRYATTVSLRRRGTSYRGKLGSSRKGCTVGRRVVLRRVGQGTRSYGSATTRGDGTYTIRRRSRVRARVYVVAAERSRSGVLCRSGRSSRING